MNDARRKAIEAMAKGARHNFVPKLGTREQALQYYLAKKNKKKLPTFKKPKPKPSDYKKLTIEEYEAKYK